MPLRTAWAVWQRTEMRELGLLAAGVAFFGFLALFPAIAAVIAIWGFWADPAVIRAQLEPLADILPPEAFKLLQSQVESLLAANNPNLGWTTVVSTVVALWSARAGVAALVRGLNAIHGLPQRTEVYHQLQAMIVTLALVVLALAAMGVAVVVPLLLSFIDTGPYGGLALEALNFLVAAMVVVLSLGLIYRFGPNHGARSVRLFTVGLAVALALWAAVSRGLVIYLANFGNYNHIYGSIGAVVALLLWFYLSAYAVLLGAAIDAEGARRDQ